MTSPPRFVRVLQHEEGEGPSLIAEALALEGIDVAITRIYSGEPVPTALDGAAGLVVLGGRAGVYEQDKIPHLRDELRLLDVALRAGAPIVGICLGSQLLAAALGATVVARKPAEIGWFPVTQTAAASTDRVFGGAPATFTTLHWHGDVFDLPVGATALASSALTEHQAFCHGAAYGLLFHLEATPAQVSAMVRDSADELIEADVPGSSLLQGAADFGPAAAAVSIPLFRRWSALLPT